MTTTTVATWNLWNGADPLHGWRGLRHVLSVPVPDVLALQEAAALRHRPGHVHTLRAAGWEVTAGARPLVWNASTVALVGLDVRTVAAGRNVGHVPGRRTVLPDYRITVAEFRRLDVDHLAVFSVVNVHTPAHNRWGGGRAAMWNETLAGVAHAARDAHRIHAGPVFLAGDWNRPLPGRRRDFRALRDLGAVSCFDGRKRPPATRGRAAIDGVWCHGPAALVDAEVLRLPHNPSDHRPVVTTWRHTAPRPVKKR